MHKEQLVKAFQLMKEGEKGQASLLVKAVLREDPKNTNAWWMMSHLLEDEDKVVKALERVLSIDPNHAAARKRLAQMRPEYSNLAPDTARSAPAKKANLAQNDDYWNKLNTVAPQQSEAKSRSNLLAGFLGIFGNSMGIRLIIFMVIVIVAAGTAAYNAFFDNFLIEDINGNTPQDVIWAYEHGFWVEDWDTMYANSCPEYHDAVAQLQAETYELLGPTPPDLVVDMSDVTMETLQRNPPDRYTIGFHGDVIWSTGGETGSYNYDDDIREQGGDVWLGEHVTRINGVWLVCTGPDVIYR